MANRTKYTPRRARAFLEAFRRTCNVTTAAEAAGVARRTVYDWRDRYPEFAEAWQEAESEACDRLEAEAWRRAVVGYDRPIYQHGRLVGHERQFSDRLLLALLATHRPERFSRDRGALPFGGRNLQELSDDELEQIAGQG